MVRWISRTIGLIDWLELEYARRSYRRFAGALRHSKRRD